MKRALITGVTGQDGAFLAELLLSKGYEVHGIKRRTSLFNTNRIDHIYEDPHHQGRHFMLHYGDLTDSSSLIQIVQRVQPDEIYNLAAQSHVKVSFEEPEYTANSDALGALRLLEAIRTTGLEKTARFYQASTSEMFGLVQETPQKETTPFYPRSPYAVAKLYAYWITINYREAYPLKHLAKTVYWWLIEGRALRDAAAVLFTCEEERIRARWEFYGHSYNEQVLRFGTGDPNGNAEKEKAEFFSAFPELRQKPFLLFLSRIHPKKGCELLLQAFAEVAAPACPELNLVMAGPDQVGWTPELKLTAQKLGINDRVHWPGMLKGGAKWGAFRSADAMILPSHQENFGFVVAEAMACSTPVLISNKVNIWREVKSSRAGLVEPDTLEGTRNLIQGFLALSEEERAQMRQAARKGFLRHFDVESTAADLLQIIYATRMTG